MAINTRKRGFSIGDVQKMTGIKPVTLRMWEQRYGLEPSHKKQSGHRLYFGEDIARLRLIKEGLNAGMRISKLAHLDPSRLIEDISEFAKKKGGLHRLHELEFYQILSQAKEWNQYKVRKALDKKYASYGGVDFYEDFLGPLVSWVGLQWQIGLIGVNHEHFISEIISGFLYSKSGLAGPSVEKRVMLTTLEGENHSLGMKMCAAVLNDLHIEPICLGASLPVSELIDAIKDSGVDNVLISVSDFYPAQKGISELEKLITALPEGVGIILGGAGAKRVSKKLDRLKVLTSFKELREYLPGEEAH